MLRDGKLRVPRLRLGAAERRKRCHLGVQAAKDANSWGGEATTLAPLSRYLGTRREAEARAWLRAVWSATGMQRRCVAGRVERPSDIGRVSSRGSDFTLLEVIDVINCARAWGRACRGVLGRAGACRGAAWQAGGQAGRALLGPVGSTGRDGVGVRGPSDNPWLSSTLRSDPIALSCVSSSGCGRCGRGWGLGVGGISPSSLGRGAGAS